MNAIEHLKMLTDYAKKYREESIASISRNSHMTELSAEYPIDQRVVDAVLTDFINKIGALHGIDYALYTSDLKKP
ncbi:MAG: hypothetical protein ACK518_04155 [bacterium]|jgi:hypothetical protein